MQLFKKSPHELKRQDVPIFGFGYYRTATQEPYFWQADIINALPKDNKTNWPRDIGLGLDRLVYRGFMTAQWSTNNPGTRKPPSLTRITPVRYYQLADPASAYDVLVEEAVHYVAKRHIDLHNLLVFAEVIEIVQTDPRLSDLAE